MGGIYVVLRLLSKIISAINPSGMKDMEISSRLSKSQRNGAYIRVLEHRKYNCRFLSVQQTSSSPLINLISTPGASGNNRGTCGNYDIVLIRYMEPIHLPELRPKTIGEFFKKYQEIFPNEVGKPFLAK